MPASCCVDITFILWQTVFSKYGCNNISQPICSCRNLLLPNQDGKLILCPLSLCRLCSHLLPSGCLSPSEVMLQSLGCERRLIQLPPCPLGHSQLPRNSPIALELPRHFKAQRSPCRKTTGRSSETTQGRKTSNHPPHASALCYYSSSLLNAWETLNQNYPGKPAWIPISQRLQIRRWSVLF